MSSKIVALSLSAIIAAVCFWPSKKSEPLLEREELAARKVASEGIEKIRFLPKAGQRYTYGFQRKILIRGFGKNPEITFKGKFYIDTISADASSFDAVISEEIAPDIITPVQLRAHISADGERIEIYSQRNLKGPDRQHVNILKDLLAHWLFFPSMDTSGPYVATIKNISDSTDYSSWEKNKVKYAKGPVSILSSKHVLTWDKSAKVPKEIKGEESTKIGADLSSDSSYSFVFERMQPQKTILSEFKNREELMLGSSDAMQSENPENAGLNWASLRGELAHLDRLSSGEQLKVFGDLVKFIKLHPDGLGNLVASLNHEDIQNGTDAFKTVVGTLATVGSPEALGALRDIYHDPDCPVAGKGTILISLTTTQAPLDDSTKNFLEGEMNRKDNSDISHGAGYALGSALAKGSGDNGIDAIRKAWYSGNASDSLAALEAMGNSGRSEFLPQVLEALASSDLQIRAKAVFALRFMRVDQAIQIMVNSLGDSQVDLREAAAGAMQLADWKEAFRAPLQNCAAKESVTRIQALCQYDLESKGNRIAGN